MQADCPRPGSLHSRHGSPSQKSDPSRPARPTPLGESNALISHYVSIEWFEKVNSP